MSPLLRFVPQSRGRRCMIRKMMCSLADEGGEAFLYSISKSNFC